MNSLAALLTFAGAGLYAALALGSINQAAHLEDWGLRAMYGLGGLYAGACAARLAGTRRAVIAASGLPLQAFVVLGALLPLAARPEGRVVWAGGAWIAAAGAAGALAAALALGDCFAIAPAARGTVARGPYAAVRHPMAACFAVLCAGYLLVRFSAWNAAVLAVAAGIALAAALLEERVLRNDPGYAAYAGRVTARFIPGVI